MEEGGECVQIRKDQFADETTMERVPECLKFDVSDQDTWGTRLLLLRWNRYGRVSLVGSC